MRACARALAVLQHILTCPVSLRTRDSPRPPPTLKHTTRDDDGDGALFRSSQTPYKRSWRRRLLSRCELRQTVSRTHFPYVLSPSRGVEVTFGENRWRVGAGVFVEFCYGAGGGGGGRVLKGREGAGALANAMYTWPGRGGERSMGGCPCLDGGVCAEGMCSGGIDNALAERLHAAAVRQQCINLTPRKALCRWGGGGLRGPRPDGGDELGHPRFVRVCTYTMMYIIHTWYAHRHRYNNIAAIGIWFRCFNFADYDRSAIVVLYVGNVYVMSADMMAFIHALLPLRTCFVIMLYYNINYYSCDNQLIATYTHETAA